MKRLFDICLSICGLAVLAIPLLIVMLVIKLDTKGPIIYWSKRVGRFGKPFFMPKFRTMDVATPEMPTNQLIDPQRFITPCGRWLRKFSIDELPQLFSVLRGDMSLVGPRPMIPQLADLVEIRRQAGVDALRPGITGWAQINGRDDLSEEEKVAFDVEYLFHQSMFFDIRIILRTFTHVIRAKNVWH